MIYQVTRLKHPDRPDAEALVNYCQGEPGKHLDAAGIGVFGLFRPLFGLATNEVYLVTFARSTVSDTLNAAFTQKQPAAAPKVQMLDTVILEPTVRPTEHLPRSREGIYVFRWFDIATDTTPDHQAAGEGVGRKIEEIIRLSKEAWVTFEGGFDTEVQGLFCEPGIRDNTVTSSRSRMLLITWYQSLSVWEASRFPAPAARENFLKRQQLTQSATPVATRLVLPPAPA